MFIKTFNAIGLHDFVWKISHFCELPFSDTQQEINVIAMLLAGVKVWQRKGRWEGCYAEQIVL